MRQSQSNGAHLSSLLTLMLHQNLVLMLIRLMSGCKAKL